MLKYFRILLFDAWKRKLHKNEYGNATLITKEIHGNNDLTTIGYELNSNIHF